MTGVVVRAARPADFPAVARLSVAAYEADGQLKEAPHYAETLADVASRAADGELLVAVDGPAGDVLGAVTFVLPGTPLAELSRPGEAEFRMLAVDPAAQGRGVGEALVRACVGRAEQLGCGAIVICARDISAPAHRLYTRLGFRRLPERDWRPLPHVELIAFRIELPAPTPA
ncbi:Ribosomal protein S18 acetylase RimI [Micromonospora pattaloongensis]|uniref:Ribosomal protein S18 acetylase RimI n=1 Tax=Micromonospora pattaloongensis TaxID=405436 RepID=A0A1H3G154_9ACTN|nr:GNAT family N-acetyltransferase [Micromonospora pattaloongensis]SDX96845.1 Ribosomal protein S18 acetylase RimI [Micromonospora pattaloongensis]